MPEWPDLQGDSEAVRTRRDELVGEVRDHAGRVAYQLARLQGGEYGQRTFSTKRGEWTVKYEAGDLQYLRYDPAAGSETYVVSTKQPPEPAALADALSDYGAFVEAYNEYVRSLDGVLDGIETEFPAVQTTDEVVAQRDRVLGRIREACDLIAGELHRYEGGEYGTFTARVSGTRWELKWDRDGASYLRVGGSGGVYLLSQYEPPSATDIREHAPAFPGFVAAYNDHVEDVESDLREVSIGTE
ncbi:hypothetical protein [Halalkalicoccus jeotgali]|uniref:Profilin fold domain-containing protein n=1 Tax=Halalkalicoccus jeotgali (strain DSM 18796 / CECT 7217 / JCM 14584 / KCTC 4019 / B3) TaxID=795797 RepID=L9VSE2_HALJB|nr:hypothetical protein [Halalkalicoccus jeotgali]ELY39966.1 hypothetical protein C497_04397 [Halalkalicoccus jeotgali B3]